MIHSHCWRLISSHKFVPKLVIERFANFIKHEINTTFLLALITDKIMGSSNERPAERSQIEESRKL